MQICNYFVYVCKLILIQPFCGFQMEFTFLAPNFIGEYFNSPCALGTIQSLLDSHCGKGINQVELNYKFNIPQRCLASPKKSAAEADQYQ